MPTKDNDFVEGDYSASLLGTISSHLEGLQGFDVMALELIQNADDAGAKIVCFDVTDDGLSVYNNDSFSYCKHLEKPICPLEKACDFHSIVKVASGEKQAKPDNIGRFGIGFVSTYQITDYPKIESSGIIVQLHPETGKWRKRASPIEKTGTHFFLPWARDSNSRVRSGLRVSHVIDEHIEQLKCDFQKVLKKSLLFLRHIEAAEIEVNGQLLFGCKLSRQSGDRIRASYYPQQHQEVWYLMRGSIRDKLHKLHVKFPKLATLHRNPNLTIALRLEPKPLANGTLYAYLPTEQSSGIPAHINADFFPESDRKAIILNGNQHQQAWNEQLIRTAATVISKHTTELIRLIGVKNLWFLIDKAHKAHNDKNIYEVFSEYWKQFLSHCSNLKIAANTVNELCLPSELLLPDKKTTERQSKALQTIGCKILSEELAPYWTVLQQFGARTLSIKLLAMMMQAHFASPTRSTHILTEETISTIYKPLAEVANRLMEQSKTLPEELREIPFLVTDDNRSASLKDAFIYQGNISSEDILINFNTLKLTGVFLGKLPNLKKFAKTLSLDDLLDPINELSEIKPESFYRVLYEIDKASRSSNDTYRRLHASAIWISGDYRYPGDNILIPGGFEDPTGQARLLNTQYFDDEVIEFVRDKIGIKTQELDTYICEVLPTIFSDNGPSDPDTYQALITELAKHQRIFDTPETAKVLRSLKIIPTQDGGWAQPGAVYFKSDELIGFLGNNKALWFDPDRVPPGTPSENFINNLGVLEQPRPRDLVARLASIAANGTPTKANIAKSAEVFYWLYDNYDPEKPEYVTSLKELERIRCFPARKDDESWYHAHDLYAPFRAEGFESQAKILSYPIKRGLKAETLKKFGININPETQLVIDHLVQCIENELEPHVTTYQILNERANNERDKISHHLADLPCVYIKNKRVFFKKNQLYWVDPKLGKYAAKIPEALSSFRPLFNAIGVKDQPETSDYIEILCDVIKNRTPLGELEPGSKPVYCTCLKHIAEYTDGEIDLSILNSLTQLPVVLAINKKLVYPQDTLLIDSPWHAELFLEEVRNTFCDFSPSLHPILEHIGVLKLSEAVSTRLGDTSGNQQTEKATGEVLKNKQALVLRMFDDKYTQSTLKSAIDNLNCFSFEWLTVVAEIHTIDVTSPPSKRKAYFDKDSNRLFIKRPFETVHWVDVFTALFHALIPTSGTTEISKTALSLSPLMHPSISLQDAHAQLNSAGIAQIRVSGSDQEALSEDIDLFGNADELDMSEDELSDHQHDENADSSATSDGFNSEIPESTANTTDSQQPEHSGVDNQRHPNSYSGEGVNHSGNSSSNTSANAGTHNWDQYNADNPEIARQSIKSRLDHNWDQYNADNPERERGDSGTSGNEHQGLSHHSGSKAPSSNTHRTPHKRKRTTGETRRQRNQRFVTYLLPDSEVESRGEKSEAVRQHNMAVEELARDAVCIYEAERGRLAEQMSQAQPGYDIKSIEESGKERFIEVKGIAGEWNQTGVGLSSFQFGQANHHGDQYWLYVVEHVATQNRNIKIHPIQNPAQRVSSFMFDHGWKDVAIREKAQPQQPFVEGARVKAKGWGVGYVRKVEWHGTKKSMIIDFDNRGERRVTYRHREITIVDEDDEPIDDTFAV